MEGMGDEEIFKSLPADERKALLVKKDDFAAKAGIENSVRAVMSEILVAALFLLDTMSRSGKEKIANGIYERY